MPTEFRTERNGTIRLDNPLTRAGGEGQVFTIAGSSSVVAKLYHQPPSATKVEKLRFQIRNSNPALESICAWPTDLLLDPKNPRVVHGILMRKMRGKEIHKLYGPTDRHAEFPTAAWDFLVHVAMNSAIAFETLHQNGAVMADVNEGNLLVQEGDGRVGLIDCDSYQVQDGKTSYVCDVGIPMWTPPELQGINFHGLSRTANHDRFGLAVIIFRLLFMGRHPFVGVPLGKEQFEMHEAIKRHLFAFSSHAWPRGVKPPPHALSLAAIPDRLRKLFERAFLPGSERPNARPTGGEWAAELKSLGAAMKRKACADAGHIYWHGLTSCPWCDIVNQGGPNFFISVSIHLNIGGATIDITAFWATIQRVVNSHLLSLRVSVPSVGSVTPQKMPMPRPVPSRLSQPVPPQSEELLPSPVLSSPTLPTKPKKAAFPKLDIPPLHPSERVWRVCLLGAICFGVGGWYCITVDLTPVAMGAFWTTGICLFYALMKGSTAARERRRRLTIISDMRKAAEQKIAGDYEQSLQNYEAEVKDILSRHAAFVAQAEAGYQRECQRVAAEFESKMNTYRAQQRLYENEKARYDTESALWEAERNRRFQLRDSTNQQLDSARDQLQGLIDTFRQNVSAELPKLEAARQQFEKARADEIAAFRELHNKRREVLLRQHLSVQSIQNASIPGVGDKKKATLAAYGYGSALDIRPDMDVPGIGDVLKGNLLAWRGECERRFNYNPNAQLPPADVRAIKIKFSSARQTPMVVIREGAAKLESLEADTRSRLSQLQLNLIEAARKHAQAAADFAECS